MATQSNLSSRKWQFDLRLSDYPKPPMLVRSTFPLQGLLGFLASSSLLTNKIYLSASLPTGSERLVPSAAFCLDKLLTFLSVRSFYQSIITIIPCVWTTLHTFTNIEKYRILLHVGFSELKKKQQTNGSCYSSPLFSALTTRFRSHLVHSAFISSKPLVLPVSPNFSQLTFQPELFPLLRTIFTPWIKTTKYGHRLFSYGTLKQY